MNIKGNKQNTQNMSTPINYSHLPSVVYNPSKSSFNSRNWKRKHLFRKKYISNAAVLIKWDVLFMKTHTHIISVAIESFSPLDSISKFAKWHTQIARFLSQNGDYELLHTWYLKAKVQRNNNRIMLIIFQVRMLRKDESI